MHSEGQAGRHETLAWLVGPKGLMVLLFGCIAVVYAATLATEVLGGDAGEFATLAGGPGVAHPPGYPLYTMLLRLLDFVPIASPAARASFLTALMGMGGAVALFRAALAWGAEPLAAGVAVVFWAFAPLTWSLATSPEVFVLNAALCVAMVAVAGPFAPQRGALRAVLLGLLAGLALANHHSAVLMAPIGIYGLVVGIRESGAPLRALGGALAAALVGLLPYALLSSQAANPEALWVWGDFTTLQGLWHHLLRADFGTLQLGIRADKVDAWTQVGALTIAVMEQTYWVGFIAFLGGTVWLLTAQNRFAQMPPRLAVFLLVVTLVCVGPLFVSRLNLSPVGVAARVVERFYLLPLTIGSVVVALGFEGWFRRLELRNDVQFSILGALITLAAAMSFQQVREHHRPDVSRYVENVLVSVPTGAVIMGTEDHRLFGFLYHQAALGERADVQYLDPTMMHYDWYRDRMAELTGLKLPEPEGDTVSTVALADAVLNAGRPLFVTNLFSSGIPKNFATYPTGLLHRVLPRGAAPPHPLEVERLNAELFDRYWLPDYPAVEGSWAALVALDYVRPWEQLASAFSALGMSERAEGCRRRADALRPTPAPTFRRRLTR
jgi:hypothetical protein